MSQRTKNRKGLRQAKSKRGNKSPKNFDGQMSINNSYQTIPRQVGLILPDRYRTNLRYWKQIKFDFTLSNTLSVRFRPSGAFDVDPTIASTAMSGFVEMSTLYQTYRVLSSEITVQVCNASAVNPANFYVVPVNFDPGATPSAAYILSLREQPYATSKMTGLTGCPAIFIKNSMSTEKIYGSKMALYDDNFSAPVTAIPNNNWYWNIGGYSLILDPNYCTVNIEFTVDVEFFDRNFLQN
jgi:hypothetical protein